MAIILTFSEKGQSESERVTNSNTTNTNTTTTTNNNNNKRPKRACIRFTGLNCLVMLPWQRDFA